MTPLLAPERKSSPAAQRQTPVGEAENFVRQERLDLYEFLLHPQFFRALPCVIGILLGFLACALGGLLVSKTNFYNDFHRFHDFISPTTLYYPTVSQMVSIAESQSKPQQTIVIVGGNSIFHGVGQPLPELWTEQLRRELGDQYAVFNFASPGSLSFEGGYWTAEALLAKKRKVIYVTVAMPTAGGFPQGGKVYGYLYWDAHEKHLLAKSGERDALIERHLAASDEKEKTRIAELRLCMQLDNLCHFQDLWTYIGYSRAFTVWTQLTASSPFKPRSQYPDIQRPTLPVEKRFGDAKELEVVRSYSDGFFQIKPGSWQINQAAWSQLLADIKGLIPERFKKNCLVVIAGNPPYYLSRITDDERARLVKATQMSVQNWEAGGYHATTYGSLLEDEDYRDCWHLAGAGGTKISRLVARNVEKINSELGFEAGDIR